LLNFLFELFTRKKLNSLLLSSGAIILSTISPPVLAEEKVNPFYFKAGLGVGWTSDVEGDTQIDGQAPEKNNIDFKYAVDDSALNLGAGIGKEFGDWRLELAYNQGTVKSDSFTLSGIGGKFTAAMEPDYEAKVKSYHFNVIKDFNKENKFSPYIGLGAGTTNIDIDAQTITVLTETVNSSSENISVFSWALIGGISYNVNESTSLFSEASYIRTAEFELDNEIIPNDKDNYESITQTNLLAGVRFRF